MKMQALPSQADSTQAHVVLSPGFHASAKSMNMMVMAFLVQVLRAQQTARKDMWCKYMAPDCVTMTA